MIRKFLHLLGRPRVTLLALGLLAVPLALSACSKGVPQEQVDARDRQIADLQRQISSLQSDSSYWRQLTSLMQPVMMPSMTDHRAYMLPSGVVLALHFDSMDLSKAQNLNWVALGLPGKFCKSDQERVEQQYGSGFTHFHDLMADTHGGAPGAMGVWFVHVAAREFDAPWGHVTPGVDGKFMPTAAPSC